MPMTVAALRDLLENYSDDTEVRLMTQPSWPFEWSIAGVWVAAPQPDACGVCGGTASLHDAGDLEIYHHSFEPYNEFIPDGHTGDDEVLYIVEGTQLAYGTKVAWEEAERTWTR